MRGRPSLPQSTQSRVVLGAVLVVVLVAAATLGSLFFTGASASPMDDVPQEADAVAHVDVVGMTATDDRRGLALRAFEVQDGFSVYRGPPVDRWLGRFHRSPHVQLSAARSATAFVAHGPNDTVDSTYSAVIVRTAWDEPSVVRAVEDSANVTLRRTTVGGRTVYEPRNRTGPTVGVVAADRYVVGERAAVVDTIGVANGTVDPVSGPLRERFAATRDGFVTIVYPFPHDVVPELPDVVGYGFEQTRLVSGVYYTNQTANGSTLGARFGLHTTDAEAARNLETTVGLGLQLYAANTDDPVIRQAVHDIRIRRDGATVSVTYEAPPSRVDTLLGRLA